MAYRHDPLAPPNCYSFNVCLIVVSTVRLNSCTEKTWATNGATIRDALMTSGLRFDENDDFYDETEIKEENVLEEVNSMIRGMLNG
jgi:hypothetical protein